MPNLPMEKLESRTITLSASRSVASIRNAIKEYAAAWVVLVRTGELGDTYYYAYRPDEILSDNLDWPAIQALNLHECGSSAAVRNGRQVSQGGNTGPAAQRIVNLDAAGQILTVEVSPLGNPLIASNQTVRPSRGIGTIKFFDTSKGFGFISPEGGGKDVFVHVTAVEAAGMRRLQGGQRVSFDIQPDARGAKAANLKSAEETAKIDIADKSIEDTSPAPTDDEKPVYRGTDFETFKNFDMSTSAAPDGVGSDQTSAEFDGTVNLTLSAETDAEVQRGKISEVKFLVQLSGSEPALKQVIQAAAKPDKPIVVLLSVEAGRLEIVGTSMLTVLPPTAKESRGGSFVIRTKEPGMCRLAVAFRQGGTDLGTIALTVESVADNLQVLPKQSRTVLAAAPTSGDNDKLALLIEERMDDGKPYFEYHLHSEALGLAYKSLRSKTFRDRGKGTAATLQKFLERIYTLIARDLVSKDDLITLKRNAGKIGVKLCEQLFDPDVAAELWMLRDRIKVVQIVSWEPYIPWELLRLRDPNTHTVDDKFLGEYGMVRTLSDDDTHLKLAMGKCLYLGAQFPHGSMQPVDADLAYFRGTGEDTMSAHGIAVEELPADADALFDSLAKGEFDVLHISCHATGKHSAIDAAKLVIGDIKPPGTTQAHLIEIDTDGVTFEAKLKDRRPLVFLNACESGREGADLTNWGGWPNVFMRAGAGAFVGTSWAVRDKPAAAFAHAFYATLLKGEPLYAAANAGRAAARALGDASWLAYKVYGHPFAQVVLKQKSSDSIESGPSSDVSHF